VSHFVIAYPDDTFQGGGTTRFHPVESKDARVFNRIGSAKNARNHIRTYGPVQSRMVEDSTVEEVSLQFFRGFT